MIRRLAAIFGYTLIPRRFVPALRDGLIANKMLHDLPHEKQHRAVALHGGTYSDLHDAYRWLMAEGPAK